MVKKVLFTYLNGKLVGTLHKQSGALSFQYDEGWLSTNGARPISLSLPLRNDSYSGDVVYNFFDNLLPDNPQIRSRIQAKFQAKTSHPFDLLAEIGKDCIGAIALGSKELEFNHSIEVEPLTLEAITNILQNYQQAPLGMLSKADHFRISMAGVQEKAAFLWSNEQWNRPLGSTPTSHIFKLPIGYLQTHQIDLSQSCENEYLCSLILEAFGLPVAKTQIEHFEETKVLVVERFDRRYAADNTWLMRLPQEDMCQALGVSPNLKYQADGGPGIVDIMHLLASSATSSVDRKNFFKAQVVFYLLAAIDGHAKNFSIFIKPRGEYCLTPLYDVMSAHPFMAKRQLEKRKVKMAMALQGKNKHYLWHLICRRHFISTASKVGFTSTLANNIIDECIEQVPAVISAVSNHLQEDFPDDVLNSIFEGLLNASSRLS